MSWLDHLLPHRQTPDTTDEATRELRKLEGRDEEVSRLGKQLREAQRVNHFSDMVAHAIDRSSPKPKGT